MAAGAAAGGDGGAGLCDAVLLAPLTEETFVHNLHVRYKRDVIYTYVGAALVCVNPCRPLPLYSPELVRAHLARPPYTLPPHLYAITATAYRWVRDRNESQCIVITGESGSGKTEAARVCLQCVVLAGGTGGAGGALVAAGTLLEAFGNAATPINHNASRFGKLLDIEFNFKGEPIGGHITHYLLEKERVCRISEDERNFHVFYQLLAGADVQLLKRLKLQRSAMCYRVLVGAGGGAPRRAPRPAPRPIARQDTKHFQHTKDAMARVGVCASRVLRVLAFILKLGNAEFEPTHNIDGSIGTHLHHHYEVWEACGLVGVDAQSLLLALGAQSAELDAPAHTPDHADSEPDRDQGEGSAEWARSLRDRLISAVYSRLFTWLVGAANQALQSDATTRTAELGILDAYGFESLAWNGLERLLINYCAERVQAAVTGATLRREQNEYAREGLPWRPLSYLDHEATAELLDHGPESLLGILGDVSAKGLDDDTFIQRLQRKRDRRLLVLPPDHFQVSHFAGPVVYCAASISRDNRDSLPPRLCAVLRCSTEPLLAALFPPVPCGRNSAGSPRRPASLLSRQRALLAALSRRLTAGPAPRLVRCLRANALAAPRRFDVPLVTQQIRTQGIMDMAQLRRAGWCESMCAREFLRRYAPGGGGVGGAGGDDPVREARIALRPLPIPPAEFAYGHTKVFIRSPRTVWELESLRSARVLTLVRVVQRAWRRRAARRARAQTVVARAWRRHRHTELRPPSASPSMYASIILSFWRSAARRRYLTSLWARLPPRRASPLCRAWPPCPWPALLAHTDRLLQAIHHRYTCYIYRIQFTQTARNRMREKVTCSALFRGRKALYARSVPRPFVGDYVRLRASAQWRRHAPDHDRYVVFAELVGKVSGWSARVSRCICVVSTCSLLLLEPRALRPRRRVPAHHVYRLSLSPHRDDLLAVHVRACPELTGSVEEVSQCSSSREPIDSAGCLFGSGTTRARRGDVLVRSCHVLELATKLFLVVQNAVGQPPKVHITDEFEVNFGQQLVTVSVHPSAGAPPAPAPGAPVPPVPPAEPELRLMRRGSHLDVLI